MEISGPYNYNTAVGEVATWIYHRKQEVCPEKLMLLGLEGLTNSGKSTFAQSLEMAIKGKELESLHIEGDLFHQGSRKGSEVFREAIALAESGRPLPEDFIQQIWREEEIRNQVIKGCKSFNDSSYQNGRLTFHNLLKFKKEGSEHSITYEISRDTVLILTSSYLRHIQGFDSMVYFSVSPEISAERKIQRDIERGVQRDPEIPRKMIKMVEYPLMLRQIEKFPLDPENSITVNIDNFEKIYLKK